jgi:purine-binding chemotaxis protein CheW
MSEQEMESQKMDLSGAEEETQTVEVPETMERCLVFESGGLVMFMSTGYVIEIINDHSVTKLPVVPNYVAGILNLRGQILPVVDIRLLMGRPAVEYDSKTCIIVLNIDSVPIGIIVDTVRQVIDIDTAQIQPVPLRSRLKLTNGMLDMGGGVTAMSFDCAALIENH